MRIDADPGARVAKAELAHGEWGGWLEAEFGWSEMTATRYMRVAGAFKSNSLLASVRSSARDLPRRQRPHMFDWLITGQVAGSRRLQ